VALTAGEKPASHPISKRGIDAYEFVSARLRK
jgi:hypothetical protein